MSDPGVDCVYVAAGKEDARLTRICVASVRHFYPDIPIRLLRGGCVEQRLILELQAAWGVELADVPSADYGWGYVKLEPCFMRQTHRFLMLDSDTALVGPILDWARESDAPFIVDNVERSPADRIRHFYDWERLRHIDPQALPTEFVFNSGQWIGTSGIMSRDDFNLWVKWEFPRVLLHEQCFFPGDQGVLNYVLNQKAGLERVRVERRHMMRWARHDLADIRWEDVALGDRSPHRQAVHWAGPKHARLETAPLSELLLRFERKHYERLGGGESLRRRRAREYQLKHHAYGMRRMIAKGLGRLQRGIDGVTGSGKRETK